MSETDIYSRAVKNLHIGVKLKKTKTKHKLYTKCI